MILIVLVIGTYFALQLWGLWLLAVVCFQLDRACRPGSPVPALWRLLRPASLALMWFGLALLLSAGSLLWAAFTLN